MNFYPSSSDALDLKYSHPFILFSVEAQIANYQNFKEVNFLTNYSNEYIASSPQLAPDQSFIVFDLFQKSENRHSLVKIDTSGANKQLISEYTFSEKTTNAENFRISRDSQRIFFVHQKEIWKLNVDDQNPTKIATLPFNPQYLSLSPDEHKVTFITDDKKYSGVYYFNMNTNELIEVKKEKKKFGAVGFRNNHQLVFSQPGQEGGLYSYDLSTKNLEKLIVDDLYNKGVPVFNKDHSRIYYLVAEQ
ncbi:TolB family protein [Fodinibius halophilus]|uniref:Dipeptidylpeptidase IV N-terminal domain-containing protein n=1 Tax=Fodinibius halophilus TaxID=1736908 RepID=A0A6M1TI30_9BACT|nr:hypothetical protein [Fodinibius halophilus]NGP88270.1 hypothetical protein [Fodinibius halophilus]